MIAYTIINIAVLGLCLVSMLKKNDSEAMSVHNTNGIRGFFILLMIAHHVQQHIPGRNFWTLLFGSAGALLTSIFFFLSGYGNYFSYCGRKNGNRLKWILQRCLTIILPFEILYPAFYFLSGSADPYIKGALTLTFPGVTNWFIKVMLGCYVIFFIIYFIFPLKENVKDIILFISTAAAIITFILLQMNSTWWSSVLLFPLGVYYARYKEKIDKLFDKWYLFAATFILFAVLHICRIKISGYFEIISCVFAVASFIFVNKKFTLNSKVFQFIGKFSYEIYLIHVGILGSALNVSKLSESEILIIYFAALAGGYILHKAVCGISNYFLKR